VIETVVGRAGVFYIENTPAGPLELEMFSGDRVCHTVLEIPDSPEIHVDLGDQYCEIPN
jgi:hypothetical protein